MRAAHRLSNAKVEKTRGPAILEDGEGLRLVIDRMGNRRWVLRLTVNGKRVNRGLGPYSKVSLARAREKATELRISAKDGKDLHMEAKTNRRSGRAPLNTVMTFRRAFEIYFEEAKRPTLMPGRFAERWVGSMEAYAFPHIGDRPVADIVPREIIEMLQPIWHTKRETASRILQRVSATFKSAIVRGYRIAGNPTEGVREELGKARPKVQHRRALPWQEVPAFMQWLHARPRATLATRLCLELIVLTSLRSEEVRFAKWGEFDRDAAEWTVPGIDPVESARLGYPKKRMKLGRDHIVPLSSGALAVLDQASALRRELGSAALVFPSRNSNPLTDNTLSKMLRDAKIAGTPHGFRTSFKTWCAETGIRDEVSEMALAHGDPDRVRAAYRRASYFEERRTIMQQWNDFLGAKA